MPSRSFTLNYHHDAFQIIASNQWLLNLFDSLIRAHQFNVSNFHQNTAIIAIIERRPSNCTFHAHDDLKFISNSGIKNKILLCNLSRLVQFH